MEITNIFLEMDNHLFGHNETFWVEIKKQNNMETLLQKNKFKY